jgi:hypothetical protein
MKEYEKYTEAQLAGMVKVYYSGRANDWQKEKYEFIRSSLLAELHEIVPTARDTGTALYIWLAIKAAIQWNARQEKINQAQAIANAQTAHTQLKNWR